MDSYSMGIFSGLCAVFVFYAIMHFVNKSKQTKKSEPYDEMQLIARGKAAICSVYASLIINGLCLVLQGQGIFEKIDMRLVFLCEILFIGLVYVCICIWKNAYLPFFAKPVKMIIGLMVAAIIVALLGIKPVLNHGVFVDGKFGIYNGNFFASAFLLIIGINIFVKMLFDKNAYKKEEREES